MIKCVFCGDETNEHLGVHFVKNDGTIDYFCSEKCRKNALKLKRDNKKLKWTEAYRLRVEREKQREIVVAQREKENVSVQSEPKKSSKKSK